MSERAGASRRERLELTGAALTALALGLIGPVAALGGRLGVLAPILALPVGLWLSRVWETLGERELSLGLRRAFGGRLGRAAEACYLAWGWVLLLDAARRYAVRVSRFFEGGSVWLILGVGLALALWLCRGEGAALARTGRLFFLALAATVLFALVLALPGIRLENLWPPRTDGWAGLAAAAGWTLSLSGYGIYALCLPVRREPGGTGRRWTVWGCAGLTAVLAAVTGTLGPVVTAGVEEPFLLLLEGVRVPGAFRRWEAMLCSVLTLADVALLALLCYGVLRSWKSLAPRGGGWGGVLCAAAFAGAGWPGMQELMQPWLGWAVPLGNLAAGVGVPAVAALAVRVRRGAGKAPIFSGGNGPQKEDIAQRKKGENSSRKIEKKC